MARRFREQRLQSVTSHSLREAPSTGPPMTRGGSTREVDVGIIGLLITLILIVILLQLIF